MNGYGFGYSGGGYGGTVADQVWLDYSLARPTDAQLKAAKTFGVCRYLSFVNSLTTKKIIWQAEYDHLLDLGIAIHLNYEWYEGRMAEGNAAGQLDGTTALSQAKALGYPKGLPITFSDDTSGTPLAAIENYLNGVKTGLSGYYKIGYYGPREKMNAVLTSGHAVFGWQPTAWSGGFVSDLANLHQFFGGAPIAGTDLNEVVKEPPFPWYAGGDVALTDEDIDKVVLAVWNKLFEDYTIPGASPKMVIDILRKAEGNAFSANTRVAALDDKVDANQTALLAAIAAIPGGGGLPATVHLSGDVDVTPPAQP
jgi:hypothetical protein